MAESDRGFILPKYGVLWSVRHQAKKTNDLINSISAKFGSSITWNSQTRFNYIDRMGKSAVFFKLHGNKFANSLELLSSDMSVLQAIKQSFPSDFSGDVQVKEGLL